MKVLGRARMAGAAVAAAAVVGGGGFALGAVTAEPGRAASPPATGALAARDPGQAVPVTVDRGGQTVTVQITLGELPGS